jgi:hypothetical protein
MTRPEKAAKAVASIEEIQQEWHELTLRVKQLEAEKSALEQENKALRFLLERVIEHRQKSHGELVMLLTGLVSRLPINDVGTIVSKLVEHNAHVSEICTALAKGKAEAGLPQPSVLKALDQTKRDLVAAVKPAVEELIGFDTPLETDMLQSLSTQPELFFSPRIGRANRCFIKGQVPRERIVREFGEEALVFFKDATTDRKLNPRPKPEEIALAFKDDFEELFKQNAGFLPDKRKQLLALYQKIQRSKAPTEQARSQKSAFQKLSFYLELLHYYENQNTEAPDVVFAQRLPALIEQLVVPGLQDHLDEKLISQAEGLLAFVINPDHRQTIVNNIGKGGGLAKSLKYVLTLRADKVSGLDQVVAEFVRHLIPPRQEKAPPPEPLAAVLRLIKPDMQRLVANGIMDSDRLRKEEAEALGRTVGKALGLTGLDAPIKVPESIPVETERQIAWGNISDLIARRNEPAVIAEAIRDRLHAKYDADEMKQSWIILIETDPISLIRIFCQLPYLADGKTDPVARPVMESYVTRLTHEKYATTYHKVVNSLKNMFKANPNSPTLLNFLALVKWVDSEAADKLSRDIGMQVPPA